MSPSAKDAVLIVSLRAAAAIAGAIALFIVVFLAFGAWPSLAAVGIERFFTDPSWRPAGGPANGQFNLTPLLVGTLATTAGAMALAAPLGLASALFCTFYAPRILGIAYRRMIELLAGVPSVVYGFWGLVVLAPLVRQWRPPGQSLLAATLILALMVLPTVALVAESSVRAVPRGFLLAAAAMGLSRWATIRCAVLPAARGGLVTAVLLATGRAVGETMAVLMVAGNVVQIPRSVFDPIRTATANIALELGYATDQHRSALFVTGLLLMAMIIVLIAAAEMMGTERRHG